MRRGLTSLELQVMTALWNRGKASIREIQETFPYDERPAYTTVQTTVYRMERKKILRRVGKLGNFHLFEPVLSRDIGQRRLIDDLLSIFGGSTQPVMAHLVESGKLTLDDIREAEKALKKFLGKED
jgi:BlaI family penicillinase repressor